MTLEETKKLKTRSGLELDRLMDGQLQEFVKCPNKTYSFAAQMILDERAKEEAHLTEMAENKLPCEECIWKWFHRLQFLINGNIRMQS